MVETMGCIHWWVVIYMAWVFLHIQHHRLCTNAHDEQWNDLFKRSWYEKTTSLYNIHVKDIQHINTQQHPYEVTLSHSKLQLNLLNDILGNFKQQTLMKSLLMWLYVIMYACKLYMLLHALRQSGFFCRYVMLTWPCCLTRQSVFYSNISFFGA